MSFKMFGFLALFLISNTTFADDGGISAGGGGHGDCHNIRSAVYANHFGLRLMRETIQENQQAPINTMLSPISAYTTLSMALNGSAGETKSNFLKALGLPEGFVHDCSVIGNNRGMAYLMRDVALAPSSIPRRHREPTFPVLTISNGAWHTNGQSDGQKFAFSPDFTSALQNSYQAEVGALDFIQPAASASINSWVSQKTFGLIPSIVDQKELQKLVWLIVNATYFEAGWQHAFTELPGTHPFQLLNSQNKEVTMLLGQDRYAYQDDGRRQAIALPFRSAEARRFSLLVVLPKPGSDFLATQANEIWQPSYWENLQASLKGAGFTMGRITLPKFAFNSGIELTEQSSLAKAMGLDSLFSRLADFSAMATPESEPSHLKLLRQLTRIELDKNGVKAAAVTAGGGAGGGGAPESPRFQMDVNRPFAFAIVEENTGALLFLGSVVNPSWR